MRQIKFKAKNTDGIWVKGMYHRSNGIYGTTHWLLQGGYKHIQIHPNTLCQYLRGNIWEGDIFEVTFNGTETHIEIQNAVIKWNNDACGFGLFIPDHPDAEWMGITSKHVINLSKLGNIHDNPELL